jgi:hypothetical protein
MVSHVRRVMKAAVNLKYVYLYWRLQCSKCQSIKSTTFPRSKKHRCSTRKLITQGIESRARIYFPNHSALSGDHAEMTPQYFRCRKR